MSGTDFYYEPQVRLAEELAALAPIDGGVQVVLRQLRDRSHRSVRSSWRGSRPVGRTSSRFSAAFHGRTMGALALTASKTVQRRGFGPLMPGVYHAPYRGLLSLSAGLEARDVRRRVPGLHRSPVFVHLVSPDEVAAIVVEPIQGEGGYVVAPDQFLAAAARAHADARHSARRRRSAVGHGAHGQDVRHRAQRRAARRHRDRERHRLRDAARRRVARADLMTWPPGTHASTFGGNPVACAAALVTIRLLKSS